MSVYSDYKCGALSEHEYEWLSAREGRQDEYEGPCQDCESCVHYVKSNEGHTEALFGELYECELWECNYESEV